jgi:hypothetical protein
VFRGRDCDGAFDAQGGGSGNAVTGRALMHFLTGGARDVPAPMGFASLNPSYINASTHLLWYGSVFR